MFMRSVLTPPADFGYSVIWPVDAGLPGLCKTEFTPRAPRSWPHHSAHSDTGVSTLGGARAEGRSPRSNYRDHGPQTITCQLAPGLPRATLLQPPLALASQM